ncbi:TPA: hypothetical protein ACKE33_004512, partial [Citrobacter sedlakii]
WESWPQNLNYSWCPLGYALGDDALGIWLKHLTDRRGKMKATVALANKLTRIVWRLLTESTSFNINRAFAMS